MTGLRRVVSVLLVVLGAVSVVLGAVAAWADSHLFDTRQVTATTSDIVSRPSVRDLLRRELTERIAAQVDPLVAPVVDVAVATVLDDPRFPPLVSQAVGLSHRLLVDGDTERLTFSLAAVWPVVVSELDAIDPAISPQLPDLSGSLDFVLTERSELPAIWRFVDRVHDASVALLVLGGALVGLGLVLGPSRWALLVLLGGGLVLATLGLSLASSAAQRRIEDRIGDDTARQVAVEVSDLFVEPLQDRLTQGLVIGALVAVLGLVVRLLRPAVNRRSAGPYIRVYDSRDHSADDPIGPGPYR